MVDEKLGKMPNTYAELIQLPGIGEYTAGAIASIAFEERVPAIDGNVMRVMSRVLEKREDILSVQAKKRMRSVIERIIPKEAGDFNQGVMELGETICVPNGEPLCEKCPLKEICIAKEKGLTKEIPVRKGKTKRKQVNVTVFLLFYQGKIAIQKRKNTGLLANLYELPNEERKLTQKEILSWIKEHQLQEISVEKFQKRKHIFSHIEWNMQTYVIEVTEKNKEYIWMEFENLQTEYAIPTAFLPFIKAYQEERSK